MYVFQVTEELNDRNYSTNDLIKSHKIFPSIGQTILWTKREERKIKVSAYTLDAFLDTFF